MKMIKNTAVFGYASTVISLGVLGTAICMVLGSRAIHSKFIKLMDKFPEPRFK